MTETQGKIRLDVRDQVAVLTLHRPAKLNAITPLMTDQLTGHIAALNGDPQIRAAVLTGAGRAFCAGSDIGGLAGTTVPCSSAVGRTTATRSTRWPSR